MLALLVAASMVRQSQPTTGVVVDRVTGERAKRIGLKEHDVILSYAGRAVASPYQLEVLDKNSYALKSVTIVIWRSDKRMTLEVEPGRLGLSSRPVLPPKAEAAFHQGDLVTAARLAGDRHVRAWLLSTATWTNNGKSKVDSKTLTSLEDQAERLVGTLPDDNGELERIIYHRALDSRDYPDLASLSGRLFEKAVSMDLAGKRYYFLSDVFRSMMNIATGENDWHLVADYSRKAETYAQKTGDVEAQIDVERRCAEVCFELGRPDEGDVKLSRAEELAEKAGRWQDVVGCFADSAGWADSRGELRASEQLYRSAIDLAEQHGLTDRAGYLLSELSRVEAELGKQQVSLDCLRDAESQSARVHATTDMSDYQDSLAMQELEFGLLDEALRDETSLVESNPSNFYYRMDLAQVHIRRKEFAQAKEDISIAAKFKDADQEQALSILATTDQLQGNMHAAASEYDRALQLQEGAVKRGEESPGAKLLESAAKAHMADKDLLVAEKLLNKAIQAAKDGGDKDEIVACSRDLADLYARKGKNGDAERLYRTARELELQKPKEPVQEKRNPLLERLRNQVAVSSSPTRGDPGLGESSHNERPRQSALLIATDDYLDYPHLSNPIGDATAIKEELETYYGFTCTMLTNPKKEDIFSAFETLRTQIFKPSDELVVFVAGHGAFDQKTLGDGMLVLRNSKRDDTTFDSFLTYDVFSRLLDNLPVNHELLLMDVCFGGTFDRRLAEGRSVLRGPENGPEISDREMVARSLATCTRRVITSGGKVPVYDGVAGQHSPFVQRLLGLLRDKESKVVSYFDMLAALQHLRIQPFDGEFGSNEPGSSFFLVPKEP